MGGCGGGGGGGGELRVEREKGKRHRNENYRDSKSRAPGNYQWRQFTKTVEENPSLMCPYHSPVPNTCAPLGAFVMAFTTNC